MIKVIFTIIKYVIYENSNINFNKFTYYLCLLRIDSRDEDKSHISAIYFLEEIEWQRLKMQMES